MAMQEGVRSPEVRIIMVDLFHPTQYPVTVAKLEIIRERVYYNNNNIQTSIKSCTCTVFDTQLIQNLFAILLIEYKSTYTIPLQNH